VEAHAVERARIILACLEGKEIQQVAGELGVSVATVSKWRQRFCLWGLRGLRDQPRPGKPVRYDAAFRKRVLATLEQSPPPGMSHWDRPAVAEELDASVHAVWRVLRREGIYLQRRRSWCVSSDKGRVQFHFTPTSASWLNQIEIVFSLLQRKTLNGASFKTKDQLRDAIEAFIQRHNERAKPFRWRKREVKGSQLKNTIINLRN
jgi:transposase